MANSSDFLVIGGGVVGVATAKRLKEVYPDCSVEVIDKEMVPAAHASGRNSGVLHAGFYYTSNTLKAKLTMRGNEILTAYCDEKKLPINKCGKLVVAKNEGELEGLEELFRRGKANGSKIFEVTEREARELEPHVKTTDKALWSPATSSMDPVRVLKSLISDAESIGVKFSWDEAFVSRIQANRVRTSRGTREAAFIINTAGLYADKIARQFGFSKYYRIMPFKGLYLYSSGTVTPLKHHIYPVPDLRNPFLGVHFTITFDGKTKIGPTAIPAFWREQYKGFENFRVDEFFDLSLRQAGLVAFADFDFKKLAVEELRKYSRKHMSHLASELVRDVDPVQFKVWGKPGIRAQLYDTKKRKLEMDFVVEGDGSSLHVLNAISPAFTCSIPFAEMLVEKVSGFGNRRLNEIDPSGPAHGSATDSAPSPV